MLMIRPYIDEDAPQLAAIHNRVYPENSCSSDGFREIVEGTRVGGGLAWVVAESALSGYAMITPVPGLQGVGDLAGCIAPKRQRCGLGSQLLHFVLEDLQGSDFRQIAHYVTDLDGPAACFLRDHDFFVEHEEVLMLLEDVYRLPDGSSDIPARLQVFSRATAVPLFCRLYEEGFSGLPWDQPFSSAEVAATLNDADNMLFLMLDGEAIGFAWVGLDSEGKGLIEPLGIVPAYQGKGFGRVLLLEVLRELAGRGAQRVEIGAWRDNLAAVQLYQSLGFRHRKTFTYLAFNLNDNRP
jgi:ribosomal protein S18 acetylase RimI-like enzyme